MTLPSSSTNDIVVATDDDHARQQQPPQRRRQLIQTPLARLRQQSSSACGIPDPISHVEPPPPFTALILLNAPIAPGLSPLLQQLWNAATYRVCADGGANRLRRAATAVQPQQPSPNYDNHDSSYIPNLITGDLDSLTPETRDYYETQHGVEIRQVVDQDCNDLDKALMAVQEQFFFGHTGNNDHNNNDDAPQVQCIVYGAFGGRWDQEMASLQALYTWRQTCPPLDIFLYNDHTMAFLLPAGASSIAMALPLDSNDDATTTTTTTIAEGPTCGLIPLGGAVESVTTRGLQWNLINQPSRFGGLVSTSNRCIERIVEVNCSDPLIFTAQVHAGTTIHALSSEGWNEP